MTQGHLRFAQTPGGARGRPGRGARALRPALTSHLLVTLSGLRSRCDRAPSPSPPTAPGIPEAGTSSVPVCHRCFLRDFRSLGHDPLQKLRPRSSGSTYIGRRGPRVFRPPEGPPPRGPCLPPGSRFTHRDMGFLPVLPASGRQPRVPEHRLRPLRPLLGPANQKPAAGEPRPRLHLRVRGGGRGHPQRGAHWLGRRGFPVRGGALSSWRT